MLLIKIVILLILTMVFVQDARSRSVYWFLFPVLMVLFTGMQHLQHQLFKDKWQPVLINIAFITIQLLLVSAYFSVKYRTWVNITKELLGWGDILFLLSIAFYLSVLNFLFFYMVSMVLVLLLWLAWQAVSKERNKQIPLAGFQALVFSVFLATDWWIKPIHLTSDDGLLSLITK